MDQEISEKKSLEVLQAYYMNALPLLQANFYSTLIEGRIHEDELFKYMDNYQISFEGPLFCCLVVHTSSNQVPKDMDARFLTLSVDKQVRERLTGKWKAKCFTYLSNTKGQLHSTRFLHIKIIHENSLCRFWTQINFTRGIR